MQASSPSALTVYMDGAFGQSRDTRRHPHRRRIGARAAADDRNDEFERSKRNNLRGTMQVPVENWSEWL
jgi:hypothetical protein